MYLNVQHPCGGLGSSWKTKGWGESPGCSERVPHRTMGTTLGRPVPVPRQDPTCEDEVPGRVTVVWSEAMRLRATRRRPDEKEFWEVPEDARTFSKS